MNLLSDKFISYHDDFDVKLEKSSDCDISLNPSCFQNCESPPSLYPKTFSFKNLPKSNELIVQNKQSEMKSSFKKHQPFRIIKSKKGEPDCFLEVKIEAEEKLSTKSKLIMKREKAKQRAKTKFIQSPSIKIEPKFVAPEESKAESSEETSNKKMLQMIRNRISAQNSRDKKRYYVHQLEETKQKLYDDMLRLRQEKSMILTELDELRDINAKLNEENQQLKNDFSVGPEQSDSNGTTQQINQAELLQNAINHSDPMTAQFLNQNKDLFASTFKFASLLSFITLSGMDQQKPAAKDQNKNEKERVNSQQVENDVHRNVKMFAEDISLNKIKHESPAEYSNKFLNNPPNIPQDSRSNLYFEEDFSASAPRHSIFNKFEEAHENDELRHSPIHLSKSEKMVDGFRSDERRKQYNCNLKFKLNPGPRNHENENSKFDLFEYHKNDGSEIQHKDADIHNSFPNFNLGDEMHDYSSEF